MYFIKKIIFLLYIKMSENTNLICYQKKKQKKKTEIWY